MFEYFKNTIFSTSYLPPSTVSPVSFSLNLNEEMLLLEAGKLTIAPLASKNGSSI